MLMVHTRRYESRIYPGSDGGATIYTIDVTSRKKSEQRLSLLAQVGRLMAVSVDSHLPTLLSEAQNIIAGTKPASRVVKLVCTHCEHTRACRFVGGGLERAGPRGTEWSHSAHCHATRTRQPVEHSQDHSQQQKYGP
jgi:hypothetical protein